MAEVDDRVRLTELYRQHWRLIFGYAARRCPSAADAADIVSEVFLTAWRRIDDVPADDEARLWLYGIARRVVANHVRGVRRRDRLGAALFAQLQAAGSETGDFVERVEQAASVQTAFAALSAKDREILQLVGWEHLTPAEAASVLGITAVAARVRLSRARARFSQLLPAIRPMPQTVSPSES